MIRLPSDLDAFVSRTVFIQIYKLSKNLLVSNTFLLRDFFYKLT